MILAKVLNYHQALDVKLKTYTLRNSKGSHLSQLISSRIPFYLACTFTILYYVKNIPYGRKFNFFIQLINNSCTNRLSTALFCFIFQRLLTLANGSTYLSSFFLLSFQFQFKPVLHRYSTNTTKAQFQNLWVHLWIFLDILSNSINVDNATQERNQLTASGFL